jgi:hypothetical protein
LIYGSEIWQIPNREINKILSTEMNVLRRSARKTGMERIKNKHIKEIMGVKGKPAAVFFRLYSIFSLLLPFFSGPHNTNL